LSEQRSQNRERFPFAAARVDELRAVFGPGVKLLYASENGDSIGRSTDTLRGRWVSVKDMVIDAPKPAEQKARRRK
jgi:hypothetical protein